MSAWTQAAWIVKKIQKNFDFSAEINNYIEQLEGLLPDINNIDEELSILQNKIDNFEQDFNNITIVAKRTNNDKPAGYENYEIDDFKNGTLWLILNE